MRIAISGSHRTGKSALIEELSRLLPGYATVDEPYHVMVEGGHEFNHPPSLEDFEAQLAQSLESLGEGEPDVLFDRCPLDLLGYIFVHEDRDAFDVEDWLPRARAAIETLDLFVFVPIEAKDRIVFPRSADDAESRALVDAKLRELLVDDSLELGVEVLEVEGDLGMRTRTVIERIRRGNR
jgi:hypothetical protein